MNNPSTKQVETIHTAALSLESLMRVTYSSDAVKKFMDSDEFITKSASISDVTDAAELLLDPGGPNAMGRSLLIAICPIPIIEGYLGGDHHAQRKTKTDKLQSSYSYIEYCPNEVEAWLLSIAVRLLEKEARCTDALALCSKAIGIVAGHKQELETMSPTSPQNQVRMEEKRSSMMIFLGRFHSYQTSIAQGCVKSMLGAKNGHNHLSSLRRSVDSKASILNLKLRELSQEEGEKISQRGEQKSKQKIKHYWYLYPHLIHHPGFY